MSTDAVDPRIHSEQQESADANPYQSPQDDSAFPDEQSGRRKAGIFLFLASSLFLATMLGLAQLRWHSISDAILDFGNGYPMIWMTVLPPVVSELTCRKSRRPKRILLAILSFVFRILIVYGGLLFVSVNVVFFALTGKPVFTVSGEFSVSNTPALAAFGGTLLAAFLFRLYDGGVARLQKPDADTAAGSKQHGQPEVTET